MKYFLKLPEGVEQALAERGVNLNNLLYCVKADLDGEGRYLDVYMTFDRENLYTVKGYERFERRKRGKFVRSCFDFADYDERPLASVESASVDRMVNSGRMLLKTTDGETLEFARFSIHACDMFEKFADRLTKTVKGETIDDSFLSDPDKCCPRCHQPYPDQKRAVCPNCASKGTTLWRLIGLYSKFKKEFALAMTAVILSAVASFVAPLFGSKMLYDEVLDPAGRMFGQVLLAVAIMVGVRLLSMLLTMLYGVTISKIAPKVNQTLRVDLLTSMQRLSLSYFTTKQTGSLMSRVDHDTMDIYSLFVDMIPGFIANGLTIIGIMGVMASLNWLLTLLLFAVNLLMALLVVRFERVQEKYYRRLHVARKSTNAIVSDALNGQRVVKAFAREDSEVELFEEKSKSWSGFSRLIGFRNTNNYSTIWMIFRMSQTLLFMLGAYLSITGNLTLGTLTLMVSYSGMVMDNLGIFLFGSDYMARCLDAGARMFEILDAEPTVAERENPVRRPNLKGDISFKNVTFCYEPGRPILKNLTMDIHAGELFGIVGKTGSGKTTLINLICRLYDPTEGDVVIDGVNLRDLAFEDIHRAVGVVSQETYLFMGTIADNIRYARPDASIDEVIAAAKAAYAHDFIMKLPDGYDTRVGSGGHNLSGGERQRVSIARAILQQPSILVLDEATAAMDTMTERKIQAALAELREGRTIISIAHRLSTLRDADTLAVIDDGKLVEKGTHDELIRQKGKYFELHKVQREALQFVEMGD